MSRSKHTRPRGILAASRSRAPHEPRGRDDPSTQRMILAELKRLGIHAATETVAQYSVAPLPRIVRRRPRPGCHHPTGRADIASVLRFFGEECTYGLRCIELVQAPSATPQGAMQFGRLAVPGRILLYDQPHPPWLLAGTLHPADRERLLRAGAAIAGTGGAGGIEIGWPGDNLRDFMLFDVLMHEIGHHLIQHYKGKRTVRRARTADHEAFADRFAQRCRLAYRRDGERSE